MLSFSPVSSSGGAAHYFETADDYYSKEGHSGNWGGEGAKELGLEGKVEKQDFKNVLDGKLPNTNESVRKHKGNNTKDRKGIDFTFSAPKSVSIQALINGDERVLKAHDEAVKSAMSSLEKLAATRKKEKGISFREHTNNLVYASFRHELSRAQDPQLHTHNIVMNLTQREDGEWRALSNEEMLKNVKVLGAVYKSELAQNMKALGYELRESKKGWELAHVDDAAIKLFSKRSRDIESKLGLSGNDRESVSTSEKQMVTLDSRPKKTTVDRVELHKKWVESAKAAKVQFEPDKSIKGFIYKQYGEKTKTFKQKLLGAKASGQGYIEQQEEAYKSIKFAVDHLTERQGIVQRSELLTVAYEHGAVKSNVQDINNALIRAKKERLIYEEVPMYQTARSLSHAVEKELKSKGITHFKANDDSEKLTLKSWVRLTAETRGVSEEAAEKSVKDAIGRGILVKTEPRYVTKEAKEAEISILAIERAGRNAVYPLSNKEQVNEILKDSNLNDGQKQAVDLILTTDSRYIGIQGTAGTGKSHMLSKLVEEIDKNKFNQNNDEKYKVVGLAPYASQNRALEQLGMESKTLASFLASPKQQQSLNQKSIVILDEASVVPAKQMLQLMRVVEKQNARLVLNGDIKQTQAVEAGKPFEQLQNSGMDLAYLTDIKRQKNKRIKLAVMQAASGDIQASTNTLAKNIIEVKSDSERYEKIAVRYAGLSESERNETIIVAGTNEARAKINLEVRDKLGIKGGEKVDVLSQVDMTRAEAREVRNYDVNMLVMTSIPQKDSIEANKQYVVQKIDPANNELVLKDDEGKTVKINPAKINALRAFDKEEIKLQEKEWVKVTNNNKSLDLRNGERYLVVANTKDEVVLKRGETNVSLSKKEPLHLQYGYATTVNSSQGLTSDRVLIDADVNSKTSNRAVYYVAISRPRNGLEIYTNRADKLSESMSREPKKFAALEMRDHKQENTILDQRLRQAAASKLRENIKPKQSQSTPSKSKTLGNQKTSQAEV